MMLRIRPQHEFQASDVTFTGTAPGALVKTIFFGDEPVWTTPNGMPCAVFEANSTLRGSLEGQHLQAGLDIVITGQMTEKGLFAVTFLGHKPRTTKC